MLDVGARVQYYSKWGRGGLALLSKLRAYTTSKEGLRLYAGLIHGRSKRMYMQLSCDFRVSLERRSKKRKNSK